MSLGSLSQMLTDCVPAHWEAQWESEPGVSASHPQKTQLPFTHTVNEMWKKKTCRSRWGGQRGGWLIHVPPCSPHTWRTWRMRHSSGWWETISWWQCSKDNPVTSRSPCIRCWWVAADQMMSEGTMPAQAVWYVALAGPERSLTLVMIIHSYSPHIEISATESC